MRAVVRLFICVIGAFRKWTTAFRKSAQARFLTHPLRELPGEVLEKSQILSKTTADYADGAVFGDLRKI
jgi:hypothetical protein